MDKGVLVVTGASRGIGAATALLAARRGYAVAVNYNRDAEGADRVVFAITEAGGRALAVKGDVASAPDVKKMFAAADGLGPLAGLVNNAGMLAPAARVENIDAAQLSRILAVNVIGPFLCTAQAIRRLSTRHGGTGGAIVNITSAAAKLGAPGSSVDYAASKGAIDTFTVGLALELAEEGIRVNAVRPGIIETEFHAAGGDPDRARRLGPTLPMARAGTPDEVAAAILWLLSGEASYVTGTTIDVTGGRAVFP